MTLECVCGAVERLPACNTKRAFMLRFNRFVRAHEWGCSYKVKLKKQWDDAGVEIDKVLEVLRR